MRRTSSRLARSLAAASAQEPDDNASNPTRHSSKKTSLEVVVPAPAEHGPLDSSLSPSANASSLEGSLYDTPDTSVVATPGGSDSNYKPTKKRVSASDRAQQLQSSALSLGASSGPAGKKRSLGEMSMGGSSTSLDDAALARKLQLEEYGGVGIKQPKLSASGKGKKAVISDSEDGLFGLDSDVSGNVAPQPASRRRPRKSRLSELDDEYNPFSSNESLSDASLPEEENDHDEREQQAAPPSRPRRAAASGRRGRRAGPVTPHAVAGMSRRVRINCAYQHGNSSNLISGRTRTHETRETTSGGCQHVGRARE